MNKRVRLDPRTKFILLLGVNLLFLVSHSLLIEIMLVSFSIVIILIDRKYKSALKYIIAFLVLLYIDRGLSVYLSGFYFTIVSFIAYALRRFLPCLILGKWILETTEVSDFVATMWKIKLPTSIIIPVSVVFRYFPTIKEEWNSIRSAMKIRGFRLSFEHVMVPLLFSAVMVSEELSAAALCRGLDNPGKHSSLIEIKMHGLDYLVLAAFLVLVCLTFILKGVGVLS